MNGSPARSMGSREARRAANRSASQPEGAGVDTDYAENGETDNVIELDCATAARVLVRAPGARDRARGLGALLALRRRDLRRVRHGSRRRRARATRPSATCRRSSTRRRATTASRSCSPRSRPRATATGRRRARSSRARSRSRASASTTRCRSTASRTSATSPATDHRHLEADAARAPVRAPLHGAGAPGRADRRRRSSS